MHEGDVEKIIGLLEDIASSSAEMNRFLSEYISSVDKLLENISNTLEYAGIFDALKAP